jgi:RNase P subunit RPR2
LEDAEEAWLEREEEIVDEALQAARSYQYGLPEDSDFIEDFLDRLESSNDEKQFFIRSYRDRHSDTERIVDRADVRHPDDISEMFCDSCESFRMSLYGVEEATYCERCYTDLDLESQGSLQDYRTGSKTYVLVGCGSDKNDVTGMVQARNLYGSSYFQKKQRFADELGDQSFIVSAKFGLLNPETVIRDYDCSIDDVDTDEWLDVVEDNLETWPQWESQDELWVLVGKRYLDAEASDGRSLRRLLNQAAPTVRYPFEQTSGIGDQQEYLDRAVEHGEPVMPYALELDGQTGLDSWS